MTYKIKHVWDADLKEFVPKRRPWRVAVATGKRIQEAPLIAKLAGVGLLLRVFQVWAAAFWYDEGVSVIFARLPWPKMIEATAGDVHPPLYYILLWLLNQTGIPLTEFTARVPSILLSVAAIYLTWILVKKLALPILILPLKMERKGHLAMPPTSCVQVKRLVGHSCVLSEPQRQYGSWPSHRGQ